MKALKQDQIIFSAERLQIPNLKTFHSLTKDYIGVDGNEKYHFFAYIKFFIFDGQKFGLVGGKTNYPYPDISFDYKKGVARTFLNDNKLRWSDEIIIVNHEPSLDDRIKDNQQAIFPLKILQFPALTLCNSANGGKALIFRRFRHLPFGRVVRISRRIPA